MSEMDAPPKMEQFWEDPPTRGQIAEHARNGPSVHHGHRERHGGGGSVISSGCGSSENGSTESGNVSGGGHSQYERNLNFATGAVEENEYGYPKKKTVRDPLSHRIIEKRRRDRMNNCLADLARLLPPSSLRKGRGRIEKTEIVELAIKHLRHLQCHPCPSGDKCEFNYIVKGARHENPLGQIAIPRPQQIASLVQQAQVNGIGPSSGSFPSTPEEHFRLGFHECMSETMHFLVEEEGMYPGDSLCIRILNHLRTHSENLMRDHFGEDGKLRFKKELEKDPIKKESLPDFNNAGGSSSSSGYQANGSSSGSDGNGGQDMESQEPFALPVPNSQSSFAERERTTGINIDYDGENSCCSTQLSLDISDVFSADSKSTASRITKPPIPAIICSSSSLHNSAAVLSSSNDEGQDCPDGGSSQHRYKFKNNIKQRFTADLMVPMESTEDDRHSTSSGKRSSNGMVTKASLKHKQNGSRQGQGENSSPQNVSCMSDNEKDSHTTMKGSGSSSPEEECGSIGSPGGRSLNPSSIPQQVEGLKTLPNNSNNTTPNSISEETEDVKLLSQEELEKVEVFGGNRAKSPLPLENSGVGVPAFALHEKGLFYIPLTIDKSALSPYLSQIDCNSPPLHPVTISVCFLLSQAEKAKAEEFKSLNLNIAPPVSSPSMLSKTERLAQPMTSTLTAITPPPLSSLKLRKCTTKESSSSVVGANFMMNRFSRQYSPIPYRYPIPGSTNGFPNGNVGPILPSQQNMFHKDIISAPYYNPPAGYFTTEPPPPSTLAALPSYLGGGGYGSSSSSSSNSSAGNHTLNNNGNRTRKRSVASLSPMSGGSGSSSLGYHSLHDKYSPNPGVANTDFYQFSPNTHNSVNYTNNVTHSHMSLSPLRQHSGHGHNYGSSNHLIVPFRDHEKHGLEMDRRRSCSPSKRSKKREVEGIAKPKPFPGGMPVNTPSTQ